MGFRCLTDLTYRRQVIIFHHHIRAFTIITLIHTPEVAMEYSIKWHPEISLDSVVRAVEQKKVKIDLPALKDYKGMAGVYMFFRCHGDSVEPLYIGKATDLGGRLRGHLQNWPLLTHLLTAKTGHKFLCVGELTTKFVAKDKAIKHIEKALIRLALGKNCNLLNKHGTAIPTISINFTGDRTPKKFTESKVKFQIKE